MFTGFSTHTRFAEEFIFPPASPHPPGAQRSWQQTANGHTHLSMSIFFPLFSCTFLCMNIQRCMNFTILRESHKSHYWPASCSLLSPSATLYHLSIKRLPKPTPANPSKGIFHGFDSPGAVCEAPLTLTFVGFNQGGNATTDPRWKISCVLPHPLWRTCRSSLEPPPPEYVCFSPARG